MPPTSKTKISRLAKRGNYDQEVIHAILDEGLFCSIAYAKDDQPFIIPTGYCRIGNALYIHGSVVSHFLKEISAGIPVVISVTLLDGLVLARSAFHHSMNYRSVVAFSSAEVIDDPEEIEEVLRVFTNRLLEGRWEEVRKPNEKEMKQTLILKFSLDEASAKIRVGKPNDDKEDMEWPAWAGVLPLKLKAGVPVPDVDMKEELPFRYSLGRY